MSSRVNTSLFRRSFSVIASPCDGFPRGGAQPGAVGNPGYPPNCHHGVRFGSLKPNLRVYVHTARYLIEDTRYVPPCQSNARHTQLVYPPSVSPYPTSKRAYVRVPFAPCRPAGNREIPCRNAIFRSGNVVFILRGCSKSPCRTMIVYPGIAQPVARTGCPDYSPIR